MKKMGFSVTQIHSLLKQTKRNKNLEKFKQKKCKILLTTDLSARGLDLQGVDLVIHYNFATSLENFIHRSGRAARGMRTGETISYVTQYEQTLLQNFEQTLDITFQLYEHDKEDQVLKKMSHVDNIKRKVKVKYLASENYDKFKQVKKQKRKFQKQVQS